MKTSKHASSFRLILLAATTATGMLLAGCATPGAPPSQDDAAVSPAATTATPSADAAPATAPAFANAPTTAPDPSITPIYSLPYRVPRVAEITLALQHVRDRLDAWAPVPTDETAPADRSRERRQGLIGYPIGVAYTGMIAAAEATGDKGFADFDAKRLQYIADNLPKYVSTKSSDDAAEAKAADAARRPVGSRSTRNPFRNLVSPNSLDACGAINAAFVQARLANVGPDLKSVIDIAADYVSTKQFRLEDGTLARNRPFRNSLWGDDMYMGPILLMRMGEMTGDRKYYDDAAKNIVQMSQRLFVPSVGLYTHAWNAVTADNQPKYYWGRANGWNIMAMAELLSVLPEDHPQREAILKLFRAHAQGLATIQSGSGLWHQMLDRPDSFLEESCTAMYTFAIARGVNRGWLDAEAFGPVAVAGWNGVATKISADGHLKDVCPGTSYASDYIYYYHRPAVDDIHGYGPTLLAGAEMIHLLKNDKYRIESGPNAPIMFIDKKQFPNVRERE